MLPTPELLPAVRGCELQQRLHGELLTQSPAPWSTGSIIWFTHLLQVTHEPHFCLLREVVNFSGGSRGRPSREALDNPCAEHFILFQICLLRDYLDAEFAGSVQGFPYSAERVIDDFVLFCMLVGNDFLPGEGQGQLTHK